MTVREMVVRVTERWVIDGSSLVPVSSATVVRGLRSRSNSGHLETWMTSSSERSLAFVTNNERAMVMLFEEEGGPGEHAVDPGAEESSDGYVLSNGQHDAYPDADTVPVHEAFRLVQRIVGTGSWPTHAGLSIAEKLLSSPFKGCASSGRPGLGRYFGGRTLLHGFDAEGPLGDNCPTVQ
ncbi:hypothetical protein [Streptomyces variabilis]